MAPPKRTIKVVLKSSSSSSNASTATAASVDTIIESDGGSVSEIGSSSVRSEVESDLDLSMSSEMDEDGNDDDEEEEEEMEMMPPRRLTARQRAISSAPAQPAVRVSLSASKPPPTPQHPPPNSSLIDTQILESEQQRKRRQQRDQKLEESKRAIVERLLQKQKGRSKKLQNMEHAKGEVVAEGSLSNNERGEVVELDPNTEKFKSRRDGNYLLVSLDSVVSDNGRRAREGRERCSVKGCGLESVGRAPNQKPFCGRLNCYRRL
jgi:hypothetical protein